MILKPPSADTKQDELTDDERLYITVHRAFVRNNNPGKLTINGSTWTRIGSDDETHYSGGAPDGGFHNYGQASINRERHEPVQITETDVVRQLVDAPVPEAVPDDENL